MSQPAWLGVEYSNMAKKKKINRKFLIILLSITVVVCVAGGVAGMIWMLPRNSDTAMAKAKELESQGKWQEAGHAYAQAAAWAKGKPEKEVKLRLEYAEFLSNWLAKDKNKTAATASQVYGGRVEQLKLVMRLDPQNTIAQGLLTEVAWEQAQFGRWEEFLDAAKDQLALTPDDASVYYRRAKAHANLASARPEHNKLAEDDYAKAVELSPKSTEYWLDWAHLVMRESKPQNAATLYEKGIKANPESAMLRASYATEYLFSSAYFSQVESKIKEEEATKPRRKTEAEIRDEINKQIRQSAETQVAGAQAKTIEDFLALASYHMNSGWDGNTKPGEPDKALEQLMLAQQADPQDPRGYFEAARIYRIQRKDGLAEKSLRDGLKSLDDLLAGQAPEDLPSVKQGRYLNGLLVLHFQLGSHLLSTLPPETMTSTAAASAAATAPTRSRADAMAEARQSIAIMEKYRPNLPQTFKLQGLLALAEGDQVKAMNDLRKAYDGFPGLDGETAAALFQVYVSQRQTGEAERILQRLQREDPTNVPARIQLLQLQLEFRRLDQARVTLEELGRMKLTEAQAAAATRLANAFKQLNGDVMAGNVEIPEQIAAEDIGTALNESRRRSMNDQMPEAIAICRSIVKQHPKHLLAWAQLISLYVNDNKTEEAKTAVADAIQANPDWEGMKLQQALLAAPTPEERNKVELEYINKQLDGVGKELALADNARRQNNKESYRAHLEAAVAIDPKAGGSLEQLFVFYLREKLFDQADKLVETAKRENIDGSSGEIYIARLSVTRGQVDQAIEVMQNVLKNRPQFSYGETLLGEFFMLKQNLEGARASYTTAYDLDPTNVSAMVGLARVAELRSDRGEYEKWIDLAYKFAPSNAYVSERYATIQEQKIDPGEAIKRREKRQAQNEKDVQVGKAALDVQNLAVMAQLYEAVSPPQVDKAEAIYRRLYELNKDKDTSLNFLAPLADLLVRNKRADEGLKLIADAVPAAKDKVGIYILQGVLLSRAGKAQESQEALNLAIKTDPNDPRGYQASAELAGAAKDWDKAVENGRKATELQKNTPSAERRFIRLLIEANKIPEAMSHLANILQASPNDVEALSLSGLACQKSGEYPKARGFYDQVIQLSPRQSWPRIGRAEIAMIEGNLDQAAIDLEEAYRLTPTLGVIQRLLTVYTRQKNLEKAQRLMEGAVQSQKDSAELTRVLAVLYFQRGEWAQMEELLKDSMIRWPDDVSWHQLAADMWNKRSDHGKAADALSKALGLRPDDEGTLLNYLDALCAVKQYDKVLEVVKSNGSRQAIVPMLLAFKGRALIGKNNQEEGLVNFQEAFKGARDSQPASISLQFREAVGKDKCVAQLKEWAGTMGSWGMLVALGQEYLNNAMWADARDAFLKALDKAPNESIKGRIHVNLGIACYSLNDFKGASDAYAKAIEIDPRDGQSFNNLAYLVANKLNDPQRALDYAEKAKALLPDDPNVADTLGWIYVLVNQLDNGEKELDRSILAKNTSANRYHKGMLLEKKGQAAAAKGEYRQGFDLIKDNPKDEFYPVLKERLDALK